MFFLVRSAVCIGLVAVAASNAGDGRLATILDRGARDAAATAGRACLRSADCLRVGADALAAAVPLAPAPREPEGAKADAVVAPLRIRAASTGPLRRAERAPVHGASETRG